MMLLGRYVLNKRILFHAPLHFWTWTIYRFKRAWLYKDQKMWNFQHMSAWHSWIGIRLVKPSDGQCCELKSYWKATLIFLRYLNANFVQKCQKCQICVIYENLEHYGISLIISGHKPSNSSGDLWASRSSPSDIRRRRQILCDVLYDTGKYHTCAHLLHLSTSRFDGNSLRIWKENEYISKAMVYMGNPFVKLKNRFGNLWKRSMSKGKKFES